MIVFLRSHNTETDGRIYKYASIADEARRPFHILHWTRDARSDEPNRTNFKLLAQTGSGWRNFTNILRFNAWLVWQMLRMRGEITHVHAVDLDTIIAGIVFGKLFRKKVIYDIYDAYSASRHLRGLSAKASDWIERLCATRADACIVPAEFRTRQLGLHSAKRIWIIENVPGAVTPDQGRYQTEALTSYWRVFSYVGIFERNHRGLEDVLRFFSLHPTYCLLIAGLGELAVDVKRYADAYPNIRYFGAVKHQDAMSIMSASDAIIALYYRTASNHEYASPNKYYEHLALGKPLITSSQTPPGEMVSAHKTGIAIHDGYEALERALLMLERNDIEYFSANARRLWVAKYESYLERHVKPNYLALIQ